MENLWSILWSCLGIILTGLISWATAALVDFLNKKKESSKAAGYLADITSIVSSSVLTITQTFVETMKKEGKWTEAAAKEAKEKALVIIKTQLTPELIKYIVEHFGDLESYLNTAIESCVYKNKTMLW